jgi:glycosyltransferase involved in cell wall biosynthesis
VSNIRIPTEKAHGIQIMKTCESIAMHGLRVVLLTPIRKNKMKENPFSFYNVIENFSIVKVWSLDFINSPVFKKFFFNLQTFTFYLSAKKYIKREHFEIFYTRDLFFAMMLSKKHKNVFYEVHTLPKRPSIKYLKTWKRVKGIIVISESIKNDLVKFGVDKNKIMLARDAVDLNKFNVIEKRNESRKRLQLPINKKIALYTGHLYEWKGADIFAKSAPKLSDIDFYVVGGTDSDVSKFKKRYNFPNLHVVGWQKHDDIPYWLNSADVLVLPNSSKERISSHYTSPMKMFEYMASGKPIVASNLKSIREVLNRKNALLVKSDDENSLCNGIKKVLYDKTLANKISKKSKADVQDYGWGGRSEYIIRHIIM